MRVEFLFVFAQSSACTHVYMYVYVYVFRQSACTYICIHIRIRMCMLSVSLYAQKTVPIHRRFYICPVLILSLLRMPKIILTLSLASDASPDRLCSYKFQIRPSLCVILTSGVNFSAGSLLNMFLSMKKCSESKSESALKAGDLPCWTYSRCKARYSSTDRHDASNHALMELDLPSPDLPKTPIRCEVISLIFPAVCFNARKEGSKRLLAW